MLYGESTGDNPSTGIGALFQIGTSYKNHIKTWKVKANTQLFAFSQNNKVTKIEPRVAENKEENEILFEWILEIKKSYVASLAVITS